MYTLKLSFDRPDQISAGSCVFEDLVEKQNKTTLFKVTEPSSVPYRCHGSCNKYVTEKVPLPAAPTAPTRERLHG
jgi:hypothetical protein